ncbi:hypothetical protein [Aurantimonas sp. 22II-16-19i]|uniref:hypothetical protein n=1 Tax=Aurantimonas sp. 22II-16-19i TaxID=1317114 RepID=UPI0009F7B95C|nr:hypothetical protein [Aurantimonas sp. 22II-16-19i]ORE97568.1 hypothetical protein ATO4_08115 [Aurantimonas sp. 22II-16-19i]
MRIIIPTTAKPVELRAIKRRPRVPASYMAMAGDFRPLALSADYHRFVNGPLRSVVAELPSVELSLSDALDCGRSWELPVLIAHLMEAAGRLGTAEAMLVWATGMVDADLNPQGADYHIALKLELSRPLFAEAAASGEAIAMVVPPPQGAGERQLIAAFCAEFGIALTIASTLEDVLSAFGLVNETLAPTSLPAVADDASAGPASSGVAGAVPADAASPDGARRRPLALGIAGLAAAGLAAAGFAVFASDPSTSPATTGHEPERALIAASDNLALDGLYAKDRAACQAKIYSGEPLSIEPAVLRSGGFALAARDGLCGLRLRNLSDQSQKLFVDARLTGLAIPGGASVASGGELSAGESTLLYFARPPTALTADAVLRDRTGLESRVPITID